MIITDRGRPVLKIIPCSVDPREALRPLRHSVVKYERPLEPAGVAGDLWDRIGRKLRAKGITPRDVKRAVRAVRKR